MPTKIVEFADSMSMNRLPERQSVERGTNIKISSADYGPYYGSFPFFVPKSSEGNIEGVFQSAQIYLPMISDALPETPIQWTILLNRPPQGTVDFNLLWNIYTQGTPFSSSVFNSSLQAQVITIPDEGTLKAVLERGICGKRYTYNNSTSYFYSHTSTERTPYIAYTYIDASEPPEVSALTPKNIIVDGDIPNLFTWSYYQAVGAPQTHVDLQYLYAGEWQAVAEKFPLTAQQYTVPAGILQPGGTQWRVRAYCNDGNTVSEWSEADITVKAKPGDPVITGAIGFPRPSVSWKDDGQQAGYQIRVTTVGLETDVVNTGTVFSQNRFWQPQAFLPDGKYTIYLRVVNSDQVWSNWVSAGVTVANMPGDPITLRSEGTRDYGVKLEWDTEGAYDQFIIIRNGKPVATTQKPYFTDYMSVGAVSYIVRGVYGEYYTDSNERGDCVKVHNAVVSRVDEISWLPLKVRRNARPAHNINMTPDVTYLRFENRPRPQKETDDSGYMEVGHTYGYTFRDRESYLKLLELQNQIVVLKDCHGDVAVGNMTISATIDNVYDFEISIVETDVKDGIIYV